MAVEDLGEVALIAGMRWVIRPGSTDWNTINACSAEDEYGLAAEDVEGKLVFDIGAHVGGVGVWLASRGARVVLVEPVPSNIACIQANLTLNGVSAAAVVLRAALGTSEVHLGAEGDAHEFIANIGGYNNERPVACTEVTLSELVAQFGAPDIVKLDCEGGEWAALVCPEMRAVPLIVGEYHPDRPGGNDYTSADIFRLLPEHSVTVGDVPTFGPFTARLR